MNGSSGSLYLIEAIKTKCTPVNKNKYSNMGEYAQN